MKKFLKILAIIIAVILLILIVAPFLFKGKIMEIAKQQINKNINARVEFSELGLSFIKNFPNVSVSLKKLTVAGIGDFEGDTLLKLNSFDVRVDIISAIKMENVKIKGIVIDRPEIYAHVLEDGSVNWDIMKEAEEELPEEVDTTAAEFTTKIALKKFEIRDAIISYTDDSSDMAASLENFDFLLKGDMSQDFTTLSVVSSVGLVNLLMDGIRYVKDASLNMNINLDADLKNSIYILKENEIALNDLSLGFDGSVKMPNEEDIEVDMIFRTNKVDFKSLLSLVPAIYMKDFQDVKTTGKLKLDGFVRGTYNATAMPDVGLALVVENAMFKYPDLPKSADNIQVDIKLFFDGVDNDNTKVDIIKFHVELGENPVDLTMNISTPVSDLHVDGNLTASIDLASLSDVIPMEDMSLSGSIKSSLDMMGYLSYIENEEYEKFKADGYLIINGFEFNSPDLPAAVKIIESSFNFSPKYVEVASFNANIGQSDMQLTGRLENFIPYMFRDETLSGRFTFKAGLINLNEFMTEGEEVPEEETAEDTVPLSVFPVPSNIDFRLVSTIDRLIYDKLEIDKTIGIIYIKDSRVVLENLSMDMLEGSMKLNGEYNTQDVAAPVVDFGIQATGIDIPATFNAFDVIGEIAPVAKNATGKINLQMTFKSLLDEQMNPVLNSIAGKGSFSSQQIGISNSGIFGKIGSELKTNKFDNLALENIKVDFEIKDGRVYIDPFETKMKTTTFIIGGDQGIDQTMNYTININVPRSELGAGANQAISNLYASAASKGINLSQSENMNLGVNVGGTFTDPKVTMNLKDNVTRTTEEIKAAVKETVKKEIETKKEEVKAKANEEAQKILAEAEKTAAQIRAEAKKAADAVRYESNDKADMLVKEAKNPIAKKAAETSAKKIRQEGEDKAKKIESEADTKAEKVLQEAREKAAKLQ